ncbi:hypothetical protein Tco_1237102 [Tanacetum coccineum]
MKQSKNTESDLGDTSTPEKQPEENMEDVKGKFGLVDVIEEIEETENELEEEFTTGLNRDENQEQVAPDMGMKMQKKKKPNEANNKKKKLENKRKSRKEAAKKAEREKIEAAKKNKQAAKKEKKEKAKKEAAEKKKAEMQKAAEETKEKLNFKQLQRQVEDKCRKMQIEKQIIDTFVTVLNYEERIRTDGKDLRRRYFPTDAVKNDVRVSNGRHSHYSKTVKEVLGLPMGRRKLEREGQREYNDPFLEEWKDQITFDIDSKNFGSCGNKLMFEITSVRKVFEGDGLMFLMLTYLHYTKIDTFKVKRRVPAFKSWNTRLLKKREISELQNYYMGIAEILDDVGEKEENEEKENEEEIIRKGREFYAEIRKNAQQQEREQKRKGKREKDQIGSSSQESPVFGIVNSLQGSQPTFDLDGGPAVELKRMRSFWEERIQNTRRGIFMKSTEHNGNSLLHEKERIHRDANGINLRSRIAAKILLHEVNIHQKKMLIIQKMDCEQVKRKQSE